MSSAFKLVPQEDLIQHRYDIQWWHQPQKCLSPFNRYKVFNFNKCSDERLSEKLINRFKIIKLTLECYAEAEKDLIKNLLKGNQNVFMVLTSFSLI